MESPRLLSTLRFTAASPPCAADHFLRVRCFEGGGWTLLAGPREAESAVFRGAGLQLRLRLEWSARELAGWPLFAVELWRAGGGCEAVGGFPLPMRGGRWATEVPLLSAAEGAGPLPPAEQLLLPRSNAGVAAQSAGALSLTVENVAERFDVHGARL